MLNWQLMNHDRIDFISSYRDRWCERCAYTTRCSAFLADAAIAMCGDAEEGLELALGTPYPVGRDQTSLAIPDWVADRWLTARQEQLIAGADPVLREALAIAGHDALLISAKLHRALSGRDRDGDDEDDHPIQNDWNGSAKVALISLERSEAAWRTIAAATTDPMPTTFPDQLRDVRRQVEDAFPHARSFIRPGFDETDR
jgi:hypothetical protein